MPEGQQVSHQSWILGIHCIQAMKDPGNGVQHGFETQLRRHQKSKTGVSVASQKGLISSKLFFVKVRICQETANITATLSFGVHRPYQISRKSHKDKTHQSDTLALALMRIDKTIFVLLKLINYSFSVMNEVRRKVSGETLKELVAFKEKKKHYYKVLHHLSDDSFDVRICCCVFICIFIEVKKHQ